MRKAACSIGSVAFTSLALLTTAGDAHAQQHTFRLDRLEVPGGPDDGFALWRPVTRQQTELFAQVGLGLSISPLRTKNIVGDTATLNRSSGNVIDYQLIQYTHFGIQLWDRFIFAASIPITWGQAGQNPNYAGGTIAGSSKTSTVDTSGPAAADLRFDLRGVILRSEDRKTALGASFSFTAPTGNGSPSNFGGDGGASTLFMITGEHTWRMLTFVGNFGLAFRPKNSINDPVNNNGLGVGDEMRWAVGAFVPFREGKYRVGLTVHGQTGIASDSSIIGNTIFTAQNTPFEWDVEGRMKFGADQKWWATAVAGSFLSPAYGAPDFRGMAFIGRSFTIDPTSDVKQVDPRDEQRARWKEERARARRDSDGDGISDEDDACPTQKEDGQPPDPSDGCPAPPDSDGDGIPDMYDKCPDRPEDKDGIEDGDGCPEDDFDMDGVPDAVDACPREPGKPSKDPKKNGCPQFVRLDGKDHIVILEQVRFKTGSANILPESFGMLVEIAELLKANPSIHRVSIEGHTDNRGAEDLNTRLSQERANAVMTWLTGHGVEPARLEAHGFGPVRPIDSNATEAGRTLNRRVEFRIVNETDMNRPETPEPKKAPRATPLPTLEPSSPAPQSPPPRTAPPKSAPKKDGKPADMEL